SSQYNFRHYQCDNAHIARPFDALSSLTDSSCELAWQARSISRDSYSLSLVSVKRSERPGEVSHSVGQRAVQELIMLVSGGIGEASEVVVKGRMPNHREYDDVHNALEKIIQSPLPPALIRPRMPQWRDEEYTFYRFKFPERTWRMLFDAGMASWSQSSPAHLAM